VRELRGEDTIIGVPQRKIDTQNGGQTCLQCKHYSTEHERRDPFFGTVTETCWCEKYDRKITDMNEGQDCLAFMKPLFNRKG